MNKQMMVMGAAIVAAAAGSASADFTYTFNNQIMRARASGYYPGTTTSSIDQSIPAAGTTMQTLSFSQFPDLSANPAANSLSNIGTFTGQAAPNRFALTWTRDGAASLDAQADPTTSGGSSSMTLFYRGRITFTTDALIRVSFAISGNDFMTNAGQDTPATLTMGTHAMSPVGSFTFNANNASNPIPNPFSFEVNVLAGQVLDFDLRSTSQQIPSSNSLDRAGWNNHQEGYFIIEQIPAPSAAALFGLGGLVAGGRRRRRT